MRNKIQIIKRLKAELTKLESIRDTLSELRDEIEAQFDNASKAHDDLMTCIDTLSEYV
jgi:uncharacterized coiled-coil DUF342 family protein